MTMTKEEAQKAYDDLISYRQQNVLVKSKENPGKIEVHHIIPMSIGGLDEESNKIALLAKEHFMAHVYLWIIHHDDEFHDQMTSALMNMHKGTKNGSRKELRDFILMSEDYQQAREEFGKIASYIASEANKGEKNPHFGQHWYKDPNSKKCGLFNENEQPNDWIRGKYASKNEIIFASLGVKNKVWITNIETKKNKLVKLEEAQALVNSGLWRYGHVQKPMSQQAKINISNAHKLIVDQEYIARLQAIANYYSLYGYDAVCKKFDLTMPLSSLITRIIYGKKHYGIIFNSQRGKKRKFLIPPKE